MSVPRHPHAAEIGKVHLAGLTPMKAISLTVSQAVAASSMSRTAIYAALGRRELTAVKAGRRTLIPVAALENYLASLPPYKAEA